MTNYMKQKYIYKRSEIDKRKCEINWTRRKGIGLGSEKQKKVINYRREKIGKKVEGKGEIKEGNI